jgi:metal-responsive CopG/Arc/MetJ family transcriptional regulator
MRLHISLDDELARQLDQRVGKRGRSTFISEAVRRALDHERRREDIKAGLGTLAGRAHECDNDLAAWVAAQRHPDRARTG